MSITESKPKYHSTAANALRPLKKLAHLSWNNILTDDYCHSKLLTLKGKEYLDKPHPFTLNFKAIGNLKTAKDGSNNFQIDQKNTWLKFSTHAGDYYLEERIWTDQRFRLFVDLPFIDSKRQYKPFATFRTHPALSAFKGTFGLSYLGDKCKAFSRISHDESGDFYVDEKAIVREKNLFFAAYLRYSLKHWTLPRYDFTVGYENKDYDIYLSHESNATDKIALGSLAANFIYRYKDYNFCTQLRNDSQGTNYTFGLLYKINKTLTLRAKVDDSLALSTSWRYKAHNKVSVILGTQWNLGEGAKAVDFSKTLPFPIGLTLDFAL